MNNTIIFAPYILTMEGNEPNILHDYALWIKGKNIHEILPQSQAKNISDANVLHLNNHVLMPGLINLHSHGSMSLLRGFADDLALQDWLNNHIWPAEGKHVDHEFVYDGMLLAMAEMIRSGTTCVNDMYFFNADVAKAGLRMGMRTFVGATVLEFPNRYAANADGYINRAMSERCAFFGDNLVQFVLAPHAPYTVSDETFKKIISLAEKEDMLIHCHIHETASEVSGSVSEHKMRPLTRLDNLGLLSERLIAAHMVHLTDEEIELVSKRKVSIAHNPASNMKLASGFAPVQKMLDMGINVGLGTDGAASNNKLDMFAEMRLSALIAKGFSGSPTALKAYDTLKMATINGASALHIDDKVGTLTVGKRADVIAVSLSDLETQPLFDPVSHLVYAAGREAVSHVWINGESVLSECRLTRIDIDEIKAKALMWKNRIKE